MYDPTVYCFQCITRLFENLERKEATYDVHLYGSHIEYALGPLFLHLDDNNEQLSSCLQQAISVIKNLDPNRVTKTAKSEISKMKNPDRARKFLEI